MTAHAFKQISRTRKGITIRHIDALTLAHLIRLGSKPYL